MVILEGLLIVAVVGILGVGIFLKMRGQEKVVPRLNKRTPFKIEHRDEKSVTLSTTIEFFNEGTQSAMIVDAYVKPQLPFEQYDGMNVRGKAEVEGKPREDDYFEALVMEHQQGFNFVAKVTLTARKGMTLEEAVAHMVDFPIEIIYREVGRTPMHFSIARIFLPAEELAKLVGVKLIKD